MSPGLNLPAYQGGLDVSHVQAAYHQNLQRAFLQSAMAQNMQIQQQLLAQNQALQQLLVQQATSPSSGNSSAKQGAQTVSDLRRGMTSSLGGGLSFVWGDGTYSRLGSCD